MQFALGTVTVLALLLTIGMGVVTWRLVREERRRSAARLAALAAELKARGIVPASRRQPHVQPTVDRRAPMVDVAIDSLDEYHAEERVAHREEPEAPPGLFERRFESAGGWAHRLTGIGVAGALLVVVVSVAIFAVPRGGAEENEPNRLDERVPVELLTLTHEREDGMLAISGTVRNPEDGLDEPQLSVLAMVFDDSGAMVASGRANLEAEILPAGSESSFTISFTAEQASRYRISFLVDETTVPHLDRRTTTELQETES